MAKRNEELQKQPYNTEYVAKLLKKHPDKIPVVFTPGSNTPMIDKRKFLMPRDLTFSQLIHIVRQKILLSPEKAIFLQIEKVMPNSNMLLSEVYELYKDKNGVLNVTYCSENTFG